ncbi:hypothetical protein GPECTOR_12g398 [Gonium pectorale]|uniref:Nudix hydrolase domain-containing protein n=1 Tax=Gonium pectorale TaxID=33097 RepID=A0A150GNK0_GONPE|nr:hypothetical protein GPECTOR_12g398 [Gonium pectorale]|eukprot:KXZ51436.1 hypothetical protein GPECTOR_12g398 [Gonium pectorale]
MTRLSASLELAKAVRHACPHAFIVLWHADAVEDPELRLSAFAAGANMVTCFGSHLDEALGKLGSIGRDRPPGGAAAACACPWCGQSGLTPDELWTHAPLHHVHDENRGGPCSVCGEAADNLAVHIHEEHWPGGPRREVRRGLGSAVVIHRKRDNKFLMVQEFAGQGFWVPGGMTDEGESIRASALRECQEEAGVDVAHWVDPATSKPVWRLVTFYSALEDEAAEAGWRPKTLPCFESAGACWVSLEQLARVPLRSARIPTAWYPHFAAGGAAKPLELPADALHLFPDVQF